MDVTESELLEEASSGCDEALSRLIELHGPAVRRQIAGEVPARFRSVLTAEDVMQETYIDAFLDIGGFVPQGKGTFRRWLVTIAKNNLRDAIEGLETKKRGGDRHRMELVGPDGSLAVLCELLGAPSSTPSGKAAAREAFSFLEEAIEQLPEDYRRVVRLYDLEQLAIEQVAEKLNRRPGAVFMLRARAHRTLRRLMGDWSKYFSSTA